jgi:hypothetical protein
MSDLLACDWVGSRPSPRAATRNDPDEMLSRHGLRWIDPTREASVSDVPEADAQEQAQSVSDEPGARAEPRLDDEVPEADALEQAQPVPLDEDEEPR